MQAFGGPLRQRCYPLKLHSDVDFFHSCYYAVSHHRYSQQCFKDLTNKNEFTESNWVVNYISYDLVNVSFFVFVLVDPLH